MQRDPFFRAGDLRLVSVGTVLVRCGILLLLAAGSCWTALQAWADYLSRKDDLPARQHAVQLSASPDLYIRLAEKREESGSDPLPELKQAAALEPENPEWRLRLATGAEMAGDFGLAESSLLKSATLSRLYQPRYLLAQYYFRRQNADQFQRWLREAFATAYGDVTPLLDLCWRFHPDPDSLAREAPSGRPEIARQFLLFLARHHQTGGAGTLARRLVESALPEDVPAFLEYCNQCLYQGDGVAAKEVWNILCSRHLLPDNVLDPAHGVSLTNSRFGHSPAGQCFDWRLDRALWLTFLPLDGGLGLTFSGNQPERCVIASQYTPVFPGAKYRLALIPRVGGVPLTEGLGWMVFEAAGKPVATQRMADSSLTFTPSTGLVQIQLIYQRPLGSMRLAGAIEIGGVRLEMER